MLGTRSSAQDITGPTFPRLLAAALNQIRQNGASNIAVPIRLLDVIAQIGAFARRNEDVRALRHQADRIIDVSRRLPIEAQDLQDIEERYRRITVTLVRCPG